MRVRVPKSKQKGLVKSHPCLRSYLAKMVATRKGKSIFFRDVGPERLPMLRSVPHPADGAAHMYKQAALNGLHGYL